MKASELMIGDWVVYDGDTWFSNPIQIEGMDIATDSLITSDRENVGFDGIQPIPLIDTILENNGFLHDPDYDVWEAYVGDIKIVVGIYHPDFINIEYEQHTPDGVNKGDLSSIVKVDGSNLYVHELQHALKLCGIEKEIVL